MPPTLKAYQIDYEFIVSNYLDKSLWKKSWTLFVYRDNVFTLNLYNIYTESDKIVFKIVYNKLEYSYELVTYNTSNTSIQILKQQMNGAIFRLMEIADRHEATASHGYRRIYDSLDIENERLREIAEEFLDDNGVSNTDIREAYIERYISNNNNKINTMLSNYLDGCKYTFLSELMLVFTKITNDATRYNNIINAIGNKGNLSVIEKEVDEIVNNLENDEYIEDLKFELESI